MKTYSRKQLEKRRIKIGLEREAHLQRIKKLKAQKAKKMQPEPPLKKYRRALMAKRIAATAVELARLVEPFTIEERRKIIGALSILCL